MSCGSGQSAAFGGSKSAAFRRASRVQQGKKHVIQVCTLMYQYVPVCTGLNPSSDKHIPPYTPLYLHIPRYTVIYFHIPVLVHTSTYFWKFSIKSMYWYILVYGGTGKSLKSHFGTYQYMAVGIIASWYLPPCISMYLYIPVHTSI